VTSREPWRISTKKGLDSVRAQPGHNSIILLPASAGPTDIAPRATQLSNGIEDAGDLVAHRKHPLT